MEERWKDSIMSSAYTLFVAEVHFVPVITKTNDISRSWAIMDWVVVARVFNEHEHMLDVYISTSRCVTQR
jgi:hypothetical protein